MEKLWQSIHKAVMWQLDACHERHLEGHGTRNSVEDEERFLPRSQTNLIYAVFFMTRQDAEGDKAKRSCSRFLEQQLICLYNMP